MILGIGQGELQVTPLQNARWTAAVATGNLVTPRLGMAVGTGGGTYTALVPPAATPVPFAGALGPVRDGMRAAVTGGTAVRLADLPVPVGGKTGTAQDGGLPDGSFDNWMTAVVPHDDPEIVVTALVRGFSEHLERGLGLPVKRAEEPRTCVAEGAARASRIPRLLAAYGRS